MKATKVIAYERHGTNLVFESINDACSYYSELSNRRLRIEQLRRIIEGDGLWQYMEDGKTKEVFFDIL